MPDANRLFFFQEMLVKLCQNEKEMGLCTTPCLYVLKSFVLQYEDTLNCKIIRNNQGSIFPSLCSCLIDGKTNCRSN